MADQQARRIEAEEKSLKALGELLAADLLVDTIVARERETPTAEAPDGEADDDEIVTEASR